MITMQCSHCESNDTIVNDVPQGRVVICLECGHTSIELDEVISS